MTWIKTGAAVGVLTLGASRPPRTDRAGTGTSTKGSAMGLSTRIKTPHGLRNFRTNLRRKRVLRHLNRDLAGFSNKQLADLLAKARMRRSDLFTDFTGNRANRQLMGHMLSHFDIDRELACEHQWHKLVHAEGACAQCANVEKCRRWLAWGRNNDAPNVFCRNAGLFTQMRLDLALLTRSTPRTYAYGAAFSSPQAEAIGDAWRRQRRRPEGPHWLRGRGQSD